MTERDARRLLLGLATLAACGVLVACGSSSPSSSSGGGAGGASSLAGSAGTSASGAAGSGAGTGVSGAAGMGDQGGNPAAGAGGTAGVGGAGGTGAPSGGAGMGGSTLGNGGVGTAGDSDAGAGGEAGNVIVSVTVTVRIPRLAGATKYVLHYEAQSWDIFPDSGSSSNPEIGVSLQNTGGTATFTVIEFDGSNQAASMLVATVPVSDGGTVDLTADTWTAVSP